MAVAGLFGALRDGERGTARRDGHVSPSGSASSTLERMSKTEINLERLLARCEARASSSSDAELVTDFKFRTFVAFLRNQLASLSESHSLSNQRSQETALMSSDRLATYRIRVEVLANRITGQPQLDPWSISSSALDLGVGATGGIGGPAESAVGQPQGGEVPAQQLEDPPQPSFSQSRNSDSSQQHFPSSLRQRPRPRGGHSTPTEADTSGVSGALQGTLSPELVGRAGVGSGAGSPGSLSLSGSARALLEQQRDIQEDLADSMLGLAQQLKANTLAMGEKVRGTEKLVDGASILLEDNLVRTTRAKSRVGDVLVRGWCTGCMTWAITIFILFLFMGMILFMKLT